MKNEELFLLIDRLAGVAYSYGYDQAGCDRGNVSKTVVEMNKRMTDDILAAIKQEISLRTHNV